jgi:hypothetical protein
MHCWHFVCPLLLLYLLSQVLSYLPPLLMMRIVSLLLLLLRLHPLLHLPSCFLVHLNQLNRLLLLLLVYVRAAFQRAAVPEKSLPPLASGCLAAAVL